MAVIAGYVGSIYVTTNASSVALTYPDQLTDSGDHITYVESNAAKRYWDDTAVPTVQISTDGGTTWNPATAGTYTVRYVGGKVIFTSANASRLTRISAGGKYFAYTTFAQGNDWTLDGESDMLDVSVIGGGRVKQYIPGLFGGKFSMKAFWVDNTFVNDTATGFKLIFSGSPDGTHRYEAYTYVSADKISAAVAKTVDENLEFMTVGGWFYN